jgi:hypothetical protein
MNYHMQIPFGMCGTVEVHTAGTGTRCALRFSEVCAVSPGTFIPQTHPCPPLFTVAEDVHPFGNCQEHYSIRPYTRIGLSHSSISA